MPVRKTYLILFIALAFLGAAINIQAGWLYVLVSFLLGFLLLEWIETWRNVAFLEVTLFMSDLIEAGKETAFTLIVKNRDGTKRGSLEIVFSSPFEKKEKTSFFLTLPQEQASFQGTFLPMERGVYASDHVEVHFMGRMGLFRRKKRIHLSSAKNLLVHPPLYPVSRAILAEEEAFLWSAGTLPRTGEGSDLFFGVREYGPRDTLQRIHWKSMARTGKVMVKQFQPERPVKITLIFDNGSGGEILPFERGVTLAANLARFLLKQGYSLQILDMKGIRLFQGEGQVREVLGYFAQVDRRPGHIKEQINKSSYSIGGRALLVLQRLNSLDEALEVASLLPGRSHLFLLGRDEANAEPFLNRNWTVNRVPEELEIAQFLSGETP